ncbi:AI-2E family transporter [Collinsella stercoris]|nr:AI-2E family transporter [Collinsella stercoris]UEA46506.1 AI-2E family transporter [Collinsella stercoris DSM 13279]UWP10975.1 AI-2E family transporter [Collinsella stercoris]
MFDQKTRRALFLIAFGVCLYAAMMHLDVVLGALSAAVDIFFPVLLGLGFAFVLNVPVSGMERLLHRAVGLVPEGRRPGEGAITMASIVLVLIAIAGVAVLGVTMLVPELIASARTVAPLLAERLPEIEESLVANGVDVEKLAQFFQGAGASSATAAAGSGAQGLLNLGLGSIASSVFAAARSTVSVLSSSVFAFVIAVYVLASKRTLGRQVNRVMDAHLAPGHAARIRHVASLATDTYSKFLSGQCLEACILGTLIFLAFSLFRLPYAGLIGFLTALFAFVPYVGAFASCAIGAFLTLLASPEHAPLCVIVYLAVQFIENQFIYPHVVGSSVGLSALWTLIAALVGGKLFGIVGIVFFIPIVAVLYELFRQWTNARLAEREARGGAAAR